MFDFQKLRVYALSKDFISYSTKLLESKKFDRIVNDQLKRASLSIMLNIAESSSRFGNRDRRHFLIIARGSVFECAAILEFLHQQTLIDPDSFKEATTMLEEISKMLFGLIRRLE